MAELKLNETPVRTSRNFNINNIKINDVKDRLSIGEFKNTQIKGINSRVKIKKNINNYELKYGVGKELEAEVKNMANNRLNIVSEENSKIDIQNVFDKENTSLVEDIEINVNENSKLNLLLKYKSKEDINYYHNAVIRVFAKKNTEINIFIVNLLNTKAQNFVSIESEIEENAKLNYCIVDFGGKNSITNYYSNLKRKKCYK